MLFLLISFISGVLTVLAPCILPLLPIIVGGSLSDGKINKKKAFTVVISLGLSVIVFTLLLKVSTLFITIPEYTWKLISGGIVLLLGIVTLFPSLWENQLLAKLSSKSNILLGKGDQKKSFWGDVIVGSALGPVFSTCSPTYFIVIATVLPVKPAVGILYLLAYTIGLCISLLVVTFVGQKIMGKLNVASDPKSTLKRVLGIIFIIVGMSILTGFDKKVESRIIGSGFFDVTKIEQKLLQKNQKDNMQNKNDEGNNLDPITQSNIDALIEKARISFQKSAPDTIYGKYQEFVNPSGFINTPGGASIKMSDYIGKKIILIDFMTYSCINCQRTFPYLNDWYSKYESKGLVIIGIHTPEFAFEHKKENVKKALNAFGIKFPVVLDNDYGTWNAYQNQYWPRKYLIDLNGNIVYDHSGEGEYQETEDKIVELLNTLPENQKDILKSGVATTTFNPDFSSIGSRETYLGYNRLDYSAIDIKKSCFDTECTFTAPSLKNFPSNTFSFDGKWTIKNQEADAGAGSNIYYNFSASKVHLVAGSKNGAKIKVTLDGDQNTSKVYNVLTNTLYTVVDLNGKYESHVMKIEIISGDLEAYAFTFS